jgi:hypothetical protein
LWSLARATGKYNRSGSPVRRSEANVGATDGLDAETYNPWSVVNLVFTHLADEGLHPVLGENGHPGSAAGALLLALGIEPAPEGNRQIMRDVRAHLAQIRVALLEDV